MRKKREMYLILKENMVKKEEKKDAPNKFIESIKYIYIKTKIKI